MTSNILASIMLVGISFCWGGTLIAAILAVYYGIKMSQDLKPGTGAWGFPLMVSDEEMYTSEGRRCRDLSYRWLAIFFALGVLCAILMNFYHKHLAT